MAAKAHIRPRPIRIAFLIEETEHWQAMLDAIFANCFGRWGGRFNLLVPYENGSMRPSYVHWLERYDPDIIYSYVDLSDAEIASIHERFYPSFFIRHDFSRQNSRDERAFRPGLPVEALGSLSVTLAASYRSPQWRRQGPMTLIDTELGRKPSQFVQENFGCCSQSLTRWPIGADIAETFETVTLGSVPIPNNSNSQPDKHDDVVVDENQFLERISNEKNLIGLSQLSAWLCPRLAFHDHLWAESVNVVVGDSFVDRVVFWNGRSHVPVWLDHGLVTVKTSTEQLDDQRFFNLFLRIIQNRVDARSGSSSNGHFKLRAAALSNSDLQALCDKFRSSDHHHFYSAEPTITLDSCVPSADALKSARLHVEGAMMLHGQDWHEIVFSESVFRPSLIYPRHIRDVGRLPTWTSQGGWALDLNISRTLNYSRFQNVQHSWMLPFRLRMVDGFVSKYQPPNNAPICVPRATGQGFLGLFGFAEGQLPEVTIPTDDAAFRTALCNPRTWWPFDHSRHEPIPGIAVDIRPSDKGKYLTALLQRSGGIHRAGEIFLQRFWKDQFDRVGGAAAATDDRIEQITRTLKKRLKDGALGCEDDWQRVGRVVLAEARNVRFANRYLRFDELAGQFESFRNAFWENNDPGSPREEWDDDEQRSLGESVQYLCQREILYQGHEWRCPRCYNKNWVGIAALKQSMECEVCSHVIPAPVTGPWHFKLDAFILEGLREHSMLSYVWCLRRLEEIAAASFFFLEPHELFYTSESADKRIADAEIDLITVADGVVRLCEIKAANRVLDIDKFANVAKRVRPDIATLAVMEPISSALSAKLSQLESALSGTNIAAELIHLHDQDIRPESNASNRSADPHPDNLVRVSRKRLNGCQPVFDSWFQVTRSQLN
jgi:hypothetical protein